MILSEEGLKNRGEWLNKGYQLPKYDRTEMIARTRENPVWVHFGAGNIFRAFQANLAQTLLNEGLMDEGITVVEGYDYEIIEKKYRPNDNYSILVTLKSDGRVEKTVVGSIGESCILDSEDEAEFGRLKEIFASKSLQMATFTITEKGYSLVDGKGEILPSVQRDFANGPARPESYIGKVVALLYERYVQGAGPIAMVSTDNCSHNGDKLYAAVEGFAKAWIQNHKVEDGFYDYVCDPEKVSFPWSMIDKITPRPDASVEEILKEDGLEDLEPVITSKNTYVAPFVNAEETEYLVIEDSFPNGRPDLEKAGVIFTDRETVDKVERMKVCTCLNPLHTSLAVYGCLLGYNRIYEEMRDPQLVKLVETIGYEEGLPVVTDPGVLNPKEFIDTVLTVRLPNPFMPDSPQRIATDTSQKLAIRFGETIKNYRKDGRDIHNLQMIPLVFAGWLRYLMGIDDKGDAFELSPDPLLETVCPKLDGVRLGENDRSAVEEQIGSVLADEKIFGLNLYDIGMADQVLDYLMELTAGTGAVRSTLCRVLGTEKMGREEVVEEIHKIGIVPVVVLDDASDAKPLGQALMDGGLPCAEVTFRTEAAEEAIRIMTREFPDMLVGAGTVLTTEQVDRAVAAGAKFIVSPGINEKVVNYCVERNIPITPGTCTPANVETALSCGLDVVKFFPAEQSGGINYIKAIAGPYTNVRFMPTGGINPQNVRTYLSYDRIIACGGSWMVKSDLIKNGQFDKIRELTREAADIVKEVRGEAV